MRSVRPILTLVALLAVFAAQPATADDGRRHVMPATQKIDMVRDLPDEPAFERDGEYFDLGYIYPVHTVNGASVASAGGDAGFVLYHDDKYVKVNASLMADLRLALGDEDPTQGYTPPVAASSSQSAAADPWGANGTGEAPSPGAGGRPFVPPPPTHGGGVLGLLIPLLGFGIIVGIRFGISAVIRAVFGGLSSGLARQMTGTAAAGSNDSDRFEARVASRLSELQGGGTSTPQAYEPAPPAARGFGRKGA